MSAELLREAAALMRERAEAATPGPWVTGSYANECAALTEDGLWVAKTGFVPESTTDARHIASWHPAVALAVADWLDEAADHLDAHEDADGFPPGSVCPTALESLDCSVLRHALKAARAYLGVAATAQPCACGSPDTYSLNPAEVVTHSAKVCRVSPVSDGGAS